MSTQFTMADIQKYGVKTFAYDAGPDCWHVVYTDGGKRDVPYTDVVTHGLHAFSRTYMLGAKGGGTSAQQSQLVQLQLQYMQSMQQQSLGGLSNGLSGQRSTQTASHSTVALVGGNYVGSCQTCGVKFNVICSHTQYQSFVCACGTQYTLAVDTTGKAAALTVIVPPLQTVAPPVVQAPKKPIADPAKAKVQAIKLGEIIGYRGWFIKDGYLRSLARNTIWAPSEVMEGKPVFHGEAGIYAFKKLSHLLTEFSSKSMVHGKVALWGDVVEHELGYRAEYAKIIAFTGSTTGIEHSELKRLKTLYLV